MRTRRSRVAAIVAAATMSLGAASTAEAQPQEGLVNLDVSGNTVQIPVAVAANVCDVDVNVLAQGLADGPANCDAQADSQATRNPRDGSSGGPQRGLVNVRITDNDIQVPVGVAANICDVDVNVITQFVFDGPATCTALAESGANA